ncbi:MAG: PKD domain-containing protein [Bacteroidota bacterium]
MPRPQTCILLVLLFLITISVRAQLPPNQPEQDCFSAIPVCQDIYVQNNAYSGAGSDPDEINPALSCRLLGEINSVWYVFKIETPGNLCFTITPNNATEDYDWSLYNLTGRSCADIKTVPGLEIACSWDAPDLMAGCTGVTGVNGQTGGPCGLQNRACIPVNAGETFVLNVSNFTGFDDGYVLDFSQSTAVLFDDTPPDMVGASPFCDGAAVSFSENVLCNTVDPGDFTVTGPGGPYTISAISSDNCDAGGTFDNTFRLTIDPPVQFPANYTVSLVGNVSDFCGNVANQNSQDVFLLPPPNSSVTAVDPQCLESNDFEFTYDGGSVDLISYIWDFGDSTGSTGPTTQHTYLSSGPKTVSLTIRNINNCVDTSFLDVLVEPTPIADFAVDSTLCLGDTVGIANLSTIDSVSALSGFQWEMGDGLVTNQDTPTHVYLQPGPYTITLNAFSVANCVGSTSQDVVVYPKPEVAFTAEENVCFYDSAHFVSLSTIRNDIANDSLERWIWSFGDSNTLANVLAPAHLYDTSGIYSVNLTVFSDKGCADSLTQDIEIYATPPPVVTFDTVCFSDRAFLQAVPVPGGTSRWYENEADTLAFFSGSTFLTSPVVFDQTYYVDALSAQGCVSERDTVSAIARIPEEGSILASDSLLELPTAIVNLSVPDEIRGADFLWSFGDGIQSTSEQPVHEYQFPGKYLITVDVVDVYGCEYAFETPIEVKKLVAVFVPSGFSPNGDGVNDEFFIQVRSITRFTFKIYNRHGNLVFASQDPDFRWKGESDEGVVLAEGVYTYRLDALDVTGDQLTEAGTVTLFR